MANVRKCDAVLRGFGFDVVDSTRLNGRAGFRSRRQGIDDMVQVLTRGLVPFPLKYRVANEVLFFHPASATLIVGDFCVHFVDHPPSLRARALRRLLGWVPGPRMPTLLKLLLHRRAALATLERVCERRPQRIVMAHGEPIESGVDAALQVLRRGLGARAS